MLNLVLTTTRLAARSALRSCLPLPRSALPSALAPSSARLLSSTAPHWASASLGAGSGKGGKVDKEKAAKDKAAAAKQREKERAAREKARAKEVKLKEKERAAKAKAKEKALKEKEKDKLAKEKKKAKEVAEKAKAKPLTKSLLHPPKAPQNAWQIFAAEYIQERRSSATPGEKLPSAAALSKEAAPLYRELDSTAKASLLEKANAQRLAYPDILASYIASLSPAQIKEENAIRSRRRKAGLSNRRNLAIPGAPKRPLTGYMQFVGDVRKNRPEVIEGAASVTEQSKLIAAEWKALTEEQRKEYNDAAIKAREEYVAELAKFEKEAEEKEQ